MKYVKRGFAGVLAAFMVSALSTVLVPFALDSEGNLNTAGYAAGVMFWAGLIAGAAGYILLRRKESGRIRTAVQKRKLPSALCFFSNRPAMVTDIVMFIGVIGTIYCAVNITANQTAAVIFLLLALAGVYAHFLLNGKLYLYIWNSKPEKKQLKEGKE